MSNVSNIAVWTNSAQVAGGDCSVSIKYIQFIITFYIEKCWCEFFAHPRLPFWPNVLFVRPSYAHHSVVVWFFLFLQTRFIILILNTGSIEICSLHLFSPSHSRSVSLGQILCVCLLVNSQWLLYIIFVVIFFTFFICSNIHNIKWRWSQMLTMLTQLILRPMNRFFSFNIIISTQIKSVKETTSGERIVPLYIFTIY